MIALTGSSVAVARAAEYAHVSQLDTVRGTITALGQDQFTLQTSGRPVGVLNALTSAATRIGSENLPYVWGGGHGQAGVPSRGERGGPGFNGRRTGFDCSGAVVAVLVAGGLWPQGSGVPNDWGVIRYLLRQKLIVPGAGTGPTEVTLYDNPGVHIFMNIDGRFWGTSDGGSGGDAKGGPGWLDDGAWDVTNKHFRRYHFVASALRAQTTAGYSMTFYTSPSMGALPATGTQVSVGYSTSKYGTMVANSLTYNSQTTVAGAVTAIASDDSSFTIEAADGTAMTFAVTPGSSVAQQLSAGQIAVNAVLSVGYVTTTSTGAAGTIAQPGQTLTAVTVTVNAPPPPPASGASALLPSS